ncbi:MAG: energy-coupling factor ABC transporter permease, partial [Mycobacterium sp.]|nr:energy-coupling factor ABC transporter permease [Mycobacterium sp.]
MSSSLVAMHMSDGIVNAQTSVMFGGIALTALGLCVWKARSELDERTVPLAGLVAAFIFAVQMINFPIRPGVSGHLLGGALAAILVGPYTGALCIGIVLVVQSLLFADGGVTALGMNIVNMGIIGVAAGYGVAVAMYSVVRRRTDSPPVRTLGFIEFLAALIGTVCASMGFVLEYAI